MGKIGGLFLRLSPSSYPFLHRLCLGKQSIINPSLPFPSLPYSPFFSSYFPPPRLPGKREDERIGTCTHACRLQHKKRGTDVLLFIPFSYLVVEELDLDVGIGRSRDVHLLQLPRLQYRHCMKERIKAPGISLLRHAPNSVCCCWACGDQSGEGPIPPPPSKWANFSPFPT